MQDSEDSEDGYDTDEHRYEWRQTNLTYTRPTAEGVFLGVETRSSSFLIGTKDGRFKTSHHNVKKVTKESAFPRNNLEDVKVTVGDYISKGASTSEPGMVASGPVGGGSGGRDLAGDKGYIPRSFRISREDGDKYDFTGGCPGRAWLPNRLGPRQPHTDGCRKIC